METQAATIQRWQHLRDMLISQLDMFETGVLSLHSNDMDVSPIRVDELKREIIAFDALIAGLGAAGAGLETPRGVWRLQSAGDMSASVFVSFPDQDGFAVSADRYIAEGYSPPFNALPWREDYEARDFVGRG